MGYGHNLRAAHLPLPIGLFPDVSCLLVLGTAVVADQGEGGEGKMGLFWDLAVN
jgi:hypothetical protein